MSQIINVLNDHMYVVVILPWCWGSPIVINEKLYCQLINFSRSQTWNSEYFRPEPTQRSIQKRRDGD